MSDPVSKADLSRQLRQMLAILDAEPVTIDALVNTLSKGLEASIKSDVNADHQRAFIIASLDPQTFTALCARHH